MAKFILSLLAAASLLATATADVVGQLEKRACAAGSASFEVCGCCNTAVGYAPGCYAPLTYIAPSTITGPFACYTSPPGRIVGTVSASTTRLAGDSTTARLSSTSTRPTSTPTSTTRSSSSSSSARSSTSFAVGPVVTSTSILSQSQSSNNAAGTTSSQIAVVTLAATSSRPSGTGAAAAVRAGSWLWHLLVTFTLPLML